MMNNSIVLNNIRYDLSKSTKKLKETLPDWEKDIFQFLVEWFSDSDTVLIHTSGSTGKPKLLTIHKSALRNSAKLTGDFFNFSSGKTALLCLPAKYIGGKMMLVRAMEWQLSLDYIEPKTTMSFPKNDYFFTAMTPPQVAANLARLSLFKNIIIGGGPINSSLEQRIQNIHSSCYATYGMSETVSHIALRKIGSPHFSVLANVSISLDTRGCLIISAPLINTEPLITNDLVEILSKTTFSWIGRSDNIINSGGIKLSPENIEKKIANLINTPFFIAGIPDNKWGEQLILLIEGDHLNTKELLKSIRNMLPKIELPKRIVFVNQFVCTENGKLNRRKTVNSINLHQ